MHNDIKKFSQSGIIADDSLFLRLRTQYEKIILWDMKERGFIPVLGMGPFFSTEFQETGKNKGNYKFLITIYGVYVGKRKACTLAGVDLETGKMYPRGTRTIKYF